MPIRYESRWFSPALCREDPSVLWVFGDNLAGWGKGGQAVIRDEPNALGIATKAAPYQFFCDADLERFRAAAAPRFSRLRRHLECGGTVVWPAAGIGTGLAQLEARAPRIWASLQRAIDRIGQIVARELPSNMD